LTETSTLASTSNNRCLISSKGKEISVLEGTEKLEYLIDLAKEVGNLDYKYKKDEYKIFGCASNLWVVGQKDQNNNMHYQFDADAFIFVVVDKDKENEYRAKGYELAETLDEGIKDWARNLAAAGIIVGTLAGVGSINNALDNSVPAVKAMNTALDMAQDAGNDELAKMIKNDLSATKIRLSSGKDLNFVKSMQDKYSKFMQTEGLAYESRLAVMLKQQLK